MSAAVLEFLMGRPCYIQITTKVTHLCPIDGTVDCDTLELGYNGSNGVIEIDSLERYLSTFEQRSVTIEALYELIRADLMAVVPSGVDVVLHGDHGEFTHITVCS